MKGKRNLRMLSRINNVGFVAGIVVREKCFGELVINEQFLGGINAAR